MQSEELWLKSQVAPELPNRATSHQDKHHKCKVRPEKKLAWHCVKPGSNRKEERERGRQTERGGGKIGKL